jgi:hypothetical protein
MKTIKLQKPSQNWKLNSWVMVLIQSELTHKIQNIFNTNTQVTVPS